MRITDKLMINTHKTSDIERSHIGGSSIGNPCDRAIWYEFKRYRERFVGNQIALTMKIGSAIEELLLESIKESCNIIYPVPMVCKEYPDFRGTADAMLLDSDLKNIAIIEIKTAKDSSFNVFKKKGIRLWYPEYYDQVQSYMGMSGVHSAILIALNKDSSELHEEWINFDQRRYWQLVEKARHIGSMDSEPLRLSESPSYFKCKMCFYNRICHG